MIPPRRPQFGIKHIISSVFKHSDGISVDRVEDTYSQTYGMPYAVLLPSGRAGICWALKAKITPGTPVLCTAYTCAVVREAIVRSGGQLRLVDIQKDGFLMDEEALKPAQAGNYAMVLCEIYGYTHDLSRLARQAANAPAVRIVDMAMAVPTKEHFERLADNDFAIMSFGVGKSMYAGWGGIGLTRNGELAEKIREMRDSSIARCNYLVVLERCIRMTAKNLSNTPVSYGFVRTVKGAGKAIRRNSTSGSVEPAVNSVARQPVNSKWYTPTTYIDRCLMLQNLKYIDKYCNHKKALKRRFHDNLKGVSGIVRPKLSDHALSHYPIRLSSDIRPLLKKYLLKAGFDVETLYFFPSGFSKSEYPNASRATVEVLDLPLYFKLSMNEVDRLCENIACGIEHLGKSSV
jgi:dTDP-4-amino-4,6-dideoxygalactose transaminase